MADVAVVGLGAMGSRIAGRLLETGHEVAVWNRTAAKAAALVARGARQAATPAEAALRADVVITMVTDARALAAVTEGGAGVADGVGDATVVEMSTVGPAAVARLRAVLPPTVGLLDAPVLGSVTEAESGSLSIFVGGPEPLAERWIPLLSELGRPIYAGPLGSGAGAKLVANAALFGTVALLGEAVALARGLGLAHERTFDVLARTPLAGQAERRRPAIESGDHPRRFALALARDAGLIAEAAQTAGVDARVLAAAGSWISDAADAGLGDSDYTAVLRRIVVKAASAS